MWTHEIKSKLRENGIIKVQVGFTNGVENVTRDYNVNHSEGLKRSIRSEIEKLEADDALFPTLVVGEALDISVPAPTQEEIDKAEEQETRFELAALKTDLNIGHITQEEYETKFSEIKSK